MRLLAPPDDNLIDSNEVDEYGLDPMHNFERNNDGLWEIKQFKKSMRCKTCRSPWCLKMNDDKGMIRQIIGKLKGEEYNELSNKQKRFRAYQRIIKQKYGVLKKGERRKCGVCTEGEVKKSFLDMGGVYTGFRNASGGN